MYFLKQFGETRVVEQLGGIFIDVVHGDYENMHPILVFSDKSCENQQPILVSSDKKREPDIGSHFSFQVSTQTVFILMISPDFLYIRNLL